ncbi:MAG: phosphatase PAP2 family protein [Pyrinomonadaceae bacterium]
MENGNNRTSWGKLSFAEIIGRIIKFFGGWLLAGLLSAIAALMFFGWLADEVFEGGTKNFDDAVRNYIHQFAAPPVTETMKIFSLIGSPLFLTVLGIAVIIGFLIVKWKRAVVLFLITMAGELVLDVTLKTFFKRARPEPFFNYALPTSFSFPSGHALGSFCFFGILAWLVAARLENKFLKFTVWAAAIFLIFAVGLSRIYLGVHFPSDVAAGYTTGLFWIATVASGDFWLKRRTEKALAADASIQ